MVRMVEDKERERKRKNPYREAATNFDILRNTVVLLLELSNRLGIFLALA